MEGNSRYRLDMDCQEIRIFDRHGHRAYTFEIKSHDVEEGQLIPTTDIPTILVRAGFLRALAEALTEAGALSGSHVEAELKATKYHLEDMRKLALK